MHAQYTSQCCLCQMRCFTIMGDHHLCCFMLVSFFFFFLFFLMLHLFFFLASPCVMWIFVVPLPGIKPTLPAMGGSGSTVLTTGLPGKFVFGTFVKHLVSSLGFPHSSVGKESACNAGDLGLIPELGRSPEEGKGYPLQYSGLENSMDCTVCGVTKSWIQLSNFHSLLSSKTP